MPGPVGSHVLGVVVGRWVEDVAIGVVGLDTAEAVLNNGVDLMLRGGSPVETTVARGSDGDCRAGPASGQHVFFVATARVDDDPDLPVGATGRPATRVLDRERA